MVLEHDKDHASQWEAIGSIAPKIGCTTETLEQHQSDWNSLTDAARQSKELEHADRLRSA